MNEADIFATAELRSRVLESWTRSAARFREDANAEEDYALDGYRGRVIVELAQNAADAAAAAGGGGSLLLRLRGREFTAANTGTPLTAEGVESLSTLRASAKRGETDPGTRVGRFGTGFAAVASVADQVTIATRSGAVAWDRLRATEEVRRHLRIHDAEHGPLAEELHRRGERAPLLRLPFAVQAEPRAGYDTEVRLHLRDEEALEALSRELATLGETLLLALPDLAEVAVDTEEARFRLYRADRRDQRQGASAARTVHTGRTEDGATEEHRWLLLERGGRFTPEELADRPTEEREHTAWTLLWALPLDEQDRPAPLADSARVVHAPTPSAVPLGLPAVLIGRFPLAPDRRHLAAGPATDRLLTEATHAYAELMCAMNPGEATALIPRRAGGIGEVDALLRERILQVLPDTPFLATFGGEPLTPRDALIVEGDAEVVRALADVVPTALPADHARSLAGLGAGKLSLDELADVCAQVRREPAWWRFLYQALRLGVPATADVAALAALPVPLADGRTVRGPRGLLRVAEEEWLPQALGTLGLRIVHPDADDPLLSRLGAVEADPDLVLRHERVRAAVIESLDAENPEAVAEAVLPAVRLAGVDAQETSWLSELALRDTEGEYCPAGELLLPDSPLRDILDDAAPVGVVAADLVERFGADTLQAVGVMWGFAVVYRTDLLLEAGGQELEELSLDGAEEWSRHLSVLVAGHDLPVEVSEFTAVRDLEYVREDRWTQALALIADTAPARAAVTEPVRVLSPAGRTVDAPSYSAWWLGRWARLDGRRPGELRLETAEPVLDGLLDPVPEGLDQTFALALGACSEVAELLRREDGPQTLLDKLADPRREVTRSELRDLYTALSAVDPARLDPPDTVRAAASGRGTTVVDAASAVVVDTPDLLPFLGERAPLPVPAVRAEALADVLDLPLISEQTAGEVTSSGVRREIPSVLRERSEILTGHYVHHTDLRVDGRRVPWRLYQGQVHAQGTEGLARAVAWSEGLWQQRHLFAALLREPGRADELLAEEDLL